MKLLPLFLILSGILFPPVQEDATMLNITDQTITELKKLREEKKFLEMEGGHYPGAPSEEIRLELEKKLDYTIDILIDNIKANPTKKYLLSRFSLMLNKFTEYDTEEREQICFYCEKIMDIFGVESSDGLLMNWLYGFNPDDFFKQEK